MADSTDFAKWLERAGQDLKLVDVIYKESLEGFEDPFCYICQQAAEILSILLIPSFAFVHLLQFLHDLHASSLLY